LDAENSSWKESGIKAEGNGMCEPVCCHTIVFISQSLQEKNFNHKQVPLGQDIDRIETECALREPA